MHKFTNQPIAELPFQVDSYHTDMNQRLNIHSLLHFLQEVAWEHAASNRFGYHELIEQNLIWVLNRIVVQLHRQPVWQDMLTIRTWAKVPETLFAHRDFEVFDRHGNKMVSASSVWLMLDAQSRRPQRLDGFGQDFPLRRDAHAIELLPKKLGSIQGGVIGAPLAIVPSDMDLNRHTNNASYVRWALDSLPLAFHQQEQIKEVDICFMHESMAGQHYTVERVDDDASRTYLFGLKRNEDAKELARIKVAY